MRKFDYLKMVRPNILALKPYASARHEFEGQAEVFLDANENPFDDGKGLNRYPDPLQRELKQQIAQLKQVQTNQLFLGNGSDEAIDLLFRIFCVPREDHAIILPPTYGMYKVAADISNVGIVEVPLSRNYQPNVKAILKTANVHSKLLFLCTPNNPTGNSVDLDKIKTLLDQFPGIVVVDEAYIDFAEQASCLQLLKEYENLVVLQTFSKAWGLAGIRLGMAYAHPGIIGLFNKVKPPYNINQLTQQAALRALLQREKQQKQLTELLAQRSILESALPKLKFVEKVYPSDANFLLVKMDDPIAVYNYLKKQKIIVRNRSNVLLCEGCLRITIGNPKENELLVKALQTFQFA